MKKEGLILRLKGWVTSETEISSQNRRLLALLLTSLAIVLGCMYYGLTPKEYWLNPRFFLLENKLRFRFPYLTHGVVGLLLCAPLYVRTILPFKSFSPYYCLTVALNIAFFAILAQLVIGPSDTIRHGWTSMILIAALLLTWLGMRSVAGFSWILVFGLATVNLIMGSQELRHWGLPFLVCAFFSLLFQAQLSPRELFQTVKLEFRGISESALSDSIRQSVQQAAETSAKVTKKGVGVAGRILIK